MLIALSTLASAQANGTEETAQALVQFLNYCATHPEATIRYLASDMVLHVHSDASYLSEPEAKSRAGGHFFMANKPQPGAPVLNNGAVHNIATIIRNVMASAAEAELAALFTNAKEACVLRTILEEMGHKQPPTPIQVDNSTANGIANETCKQIRSKAIDMRFYWVRDRIAQNQFHVYWAPGKTNLADYFTKHHPAKHHQAVRQYYLHTPNSRTHLHQVTVPTDTALRGCVETREEESHGQLSETRTELTRVSKPVQDGKMPDQWLSERTQRAIEKAHISARASNRRADGNLKPLPFATQRKAVTQMLKCTGKPMSSVLSRLIS